MAQKRSLSKITDFMTGSSRKEREEGDVNCVPPPPKRGCHRGTFDPKWTDEFPWVVYVPVDREDGVLCKLCRKHNDASKRMVCLRLPVCFSARINCAITSGHDATLTLYKLKQ